MEGEPEPSSRILGADGWEQIGDCLIECLDGSGFCGAELLLEFGPGFLDGVGQAANAAEGRVDVDFDLARLLIRRETGCDYVQFILPDWDDGKVEDSLYIAGCEGLTK